MSRRLQRLAIGVAVVLLIGAALSIVCESEAEQVAPAGGIASVGWGDAGAPRQRPPAPLPTPHAGAAQLVEQRPVQSPEAASTTLSIEQMQAIIARHFPEQPAAAWAVAWCESRAYPRAVGAAGERGLMQIAPVHLPRILKLGYTWDDMFLAEPNVVVARDIWDEAGWAPWSCARG